jgi:hypothetical protein
MSNESKSGESFHHYPEFHRGGATADEWVRTVGQTVTYGVYGVETRNWNHAGANGSVTGNQQGAAQT